MLSFLCRMNSPHAPRPCPANRAPAVLSASIASSEDTGHEQSCRVATFCTGLAYNNGSSAVVRDPANAKKSKHNGNCVWRRRVLRDICGPTGQKAAIWHIPCGAAARTETARSVVLLSNSCVVLLSNSNPALDSCTCVQPMVIIHMAWQCVFLPMGRPWP